MAAPKYGRLFHRSHGDCFIHATAFFVKYWNFSLTQEGLGIVKVTIVHPQERVFLACISPRPLPYENVQRRVNHRKYLEIDPKFATELDIPHDTEVVLEPVRSIEKCMKLNVAPKNSVDYDSLYSNIEKINFELAERIRVVSCQTFFTFPVWIDNNAVSVKVVSSEPSANWVMIVPDKTMVELSRGTICADSEEDVNCIVSPDPEPLNEDSPFIQTASSSLYMPKDSRSKSSASAESSVDTESAHDNWTNLLIEGARRLLDISGLRDSRINRGIQESNEEKDVLIRTQPSCSLDEQYIGYPFLSKEGEVLVNSEKLAATMCMRGSNLTPEPMTSHSNSSSTKPSHKRTATWHSETEFSPTKPLLSRKKKDPILKNKLSSYIHTPLMSANLRVQPHPIRGLRSRYKQLSVDFNHLWDHDKILDVYVHPSSLPELYHYLKKISTYKAFLVELTPIPQLNKYVSKSAEVVLKYDGALDTSEGDHASKNSKVEKDFPSSLVVRLCFATKITVEKDVMTTCVSEPLQEAIKKEEESSVLKVIVQVGHIVMSDLVRQQLEIKECSRIKLNHVHDRWRMSFVDEIKIVIQPLGYDKKDNFKHLLANFREWVGNVSDVSMFGAIVVHKQIIALQDNNGDWINCRLNVTSGKLLHNSGTRISYCLLTLNDWKRFSLLVDSVSKRGPLNFRHSQAPSQSKESFLRGDNLVVEGDVKLPDMATLNQIRITMKSSDFGAFDHLLSEATAHLQSVFTDQRRCGTLLVCGMSGSAGSGCGKSSLVRMIVKEAMRPPYHAFVRFSECTFLRSQSTTRTKKRLSSTFSEVIQNQPSVLVLEDLDQAMPLVSDAQEQVQEEGINSNNKTQVFKDLLRKLRCKQAQVLVIATAQNRQHLNRELVTSQGTYTFDKVLEIQPPSLIDRKEIIQAILCRKNIPSLSDPDLRAVASRTEGFQAGDLVTLIDRAVSHSELRVLCPTHYTPFDKSQDHLYRKLSMDDSGSDLETSIELSSSPHKSFHGRNSPKSYLSLSESHQDSHLSSSTVQQKKLSVGSNSTLTPATPRSLEKRGFVVTRVPSLSQMTLTVDDFVTALDGLVPVSLRGLPLHTTGTVSFSHVGGLEDIKQALRETLLWPTKYPKLFSQCPIKQHCGVLLYGAPGTGKTLLAGAVAKEFGLNFVSVKGPELLSKYIGASEKAVRDIFTRAQSARPCILFFDEFDSLAPRRGHDNTGVTDRVVNQLLTQLDGVEALMGVYVLAASSRPDLIDPALLRPGRIDVRLFCKMPVEDERYEILRALIRDVKYSTDINLREIAKPCNTEHFTGADLKALLYNAQLQAAHSVLDERRKKSVESNFSISITPESSPDTSIKHPKEGNSSMVFSYGGSGVVKYPVVPTDIKNKIGQLQNRLIRKKKNTPVSSNMDFLRGTDPGHSLTAKRVVTLTQEWLLSAVKDVKPSVSELERMKYSKIYDKFTGKAEKTTTREIKPVVTLA